MHAVRGRAIDEEETIGCAAHRQRPIERKRVRRTASIVSAASRALVDHRRTFSGIRLDALFAADPNRFSHLSFRWGDWLIDLSKERWTPETIALLLSYARDCELVSWISALFAGEKVN